MIDTKSSESRENGTMVEVTGPNRFHRVGETAPAGSFELLSEADAGSAAVRMILPTCAGARPTHPPALSTTVSSAPSSGPVWYSPRISRLVALASTRRICSWLAGAFQFQRQPASAVSFTDKGVQPVPGEVVKRNDSRPAGPTMTTSSSRKPG